MARFSPTPGPLTAWQKVQNGLYYLHVVLATIVLGIWGLFVVALRKDGAHLVPRVWTGHLLRAARWHLGLVCEVRGTPPTQDCIVAAKHQCPLDIIAISHAVPRRGFVMKQEVARVPIMGWFALKAGCIPIDRSRGKDAMKQIIAQVRARMAGEGLGQLIIYPEGTRTLPGERRPYKHGVATIQSQTGLDIVPVAVNTGLFWPRKGWGIRPGRAVIEFLPPIPAGLSHDAVMAQLAEAIETRSDALMAEAGFTPLPGGSPRDPE